MISSVMGFQFAAMTVFSTFENDFHDPGSVESARRELSGGGCCLGRFCVSYYLTCCCRSAACTSISSWLIDHRNRVSSCRGGRSSASSPAFSVLGAP